MENKCIKESSWATLFLINLYCEDVKYFKQIRQATYQMTKKQNISTLLAKVLKTEPVELPVHRFYWLDQFSKHFF